MITIIILLSNLLALQDKENSHTISVQVTNNKLNQDSTEQLPV